MISSSSDSQDNARTSSGHAEGSQSPEKGGSGSPVVATAPSLALSTASAPVLSSTTPLSPNDGSGIVYLNVGGQQFITRYETLISHGHNFVSLLIDNDAQGKISAPRDHNGYLIIDRSSQLFAYYLRTDYLPPPTHPLRPQLELELDYYQIHRDNFGLSSDGVLQRRQSFEINEKITSSIEKWRAKANAFVTAHGEYLLAKLLDELDAGYDTLKESYPAVNGQVKVGAESLLLERYGVSARWKSYSSSLVLLLHQGPQNVELVQDIRDMLEATFEPHGRRLRVHQCYDLNEERTSREKKKK